MGKAYIVKAARAERGTDRHSFDWRKARRTELELTPGLWIRIGQTVLKPADVVLAVVVHVHAVFAPKLWLQIETTRDSWLMLLNPGIDVETELGMPCQVEHVRPDFSIFRFLVSVALIAAAGTFVYLRYGAEIALWAGHWLDRLGAAVG